MISIIIPALNEEKALPATLGALTAQLADFDVTVVDGASSDRTPAIVENFAARDPRFRLLRSRRGRAAQMNAGAAAAAGRWLLFLHADTILPEGALSLISDQDETVDAGCFRHRFSGSGRTLRVLSWFQNRRFQVTRVVYGDQGLFVRRELFDKLGGFPDRQMEDIAFGLRLRKATRPIMVPLTVVTDSRKFEQLGPLAATAHAVRLLVRFRFRADLERDPFFAEYR
jgi:rSAM/selenodomain-associated transferase 2